MKTEEPPWSKKRRLGVLNVLQVVRLEYRRRWERQGVGSRARRAE